MIFVLLYIGFISVYIFMFYLDPWVWGTFVND